MKVPYSSQILSEHAGSGSNLEFIGHDEDSRPVFSGYWDDGTPVVMVGEPGEWFTAWEGESYNGGCTDRFDDDLFAATLEAECRCGIKRKG